MPIIPNSERTPSQLREQTRKGGIASGKARREKKMMREICLKMLNSALSPEMAKNLDAFKMLGKGDATFSAAIIAKQISLALKGNVNAAKFLVETSDQKNAEKIEANVTKNIGDMTDDELAEKLKEINRKLE